MFNLSKKSDAQPVAAPLWHTNFRNFDQLPDTKVVRTTFFVNTAAIAITTVLLLGFGYREYHLYTLSTQIAEAQKQIDDNSKKNQEALRLTAVFEGEEAKLVEGEEFVKSPVSPTEFIALLGRTLPKEISIEFAETRYGNPATAAKGAFNLRGLVAGTPDQATGTASTYVDSLRSPKNLGGIFEPITLEKLTRDATGSLMSFEISLKFKADSKEKKK
jgi:hypothetical protein